MGSYNQHSRSDTRVSCATMRILLLSLLVSFVVCQSPEAQEPPPGQRCSGRNYNGRRCCTPEKPCGLGEGDCDGPLDGGTHDGHQGCRGDLVCGSNNCRKFGAYFHEKDDCCDRPENLPVREEPVFVPGAPLEPPAGQRCRGRNYDGKRCCTPENPCDEGEGDCDGPGDGGLNDGHAGCKGDLVCGSNNCLKFGAYYHEKDDCCEKSTSPLNAPKSPEFDRNEKQGWGPWSSWGPCSHTCAAGRKTRQRQCLGKCKNHHLFENQERICVNPECNFL